MDVTPITTLRCPVGALRPGLSLPGDRLLPMSSFTLLAVDGNSLLHRSFHAQARTGFRLGDGSPGWAVRGLVSELVAAVDRACADLVVVGFDDPEVSVRRETWPHYKAQRPDKLDTLAQQLRIAIEALQAAGVHVVIPTGLEADDVLASAATWAAHAGGATVIASSDRDAFALIDQHTRVLRVINGGIAASPMLTPQRLQLLMGVTPRQYRDLAALRGDPSDNLPGVRGVGRKTAAALLAHFGSAQTMFDDAVAGGVRCREVVGPALVARLADPAARTSWQQNLDVMAMRHDVPLGLGGSTGRLPLDPGAVGELAHRVQVSRQQAVRALCLTEQAPIVNVRDTDPTWVPPPARSSRRFPSLPKKVQQLALF